MTRLSTKLPNSRPEKLPHFKGDILDEQHRRIAAAAREADFVFLGAGRFAEHQTAREFVRYLGIDPETFKKEYNNIAYMCGYCGIDCDGEEVEFRESFEERMPRALRFGDLRSMAAQPGKGVALLAKGDAKVDVVATVVKAGIINTLFLDGPLAVGLLDKLTPETAILEN